MPKFVKWLETVTARWHSRVGHTWGPGSRPSRQTLAAWLAAASTGAAGL